MIVKILLDECLPKKLKFRIEELDQDFIVRTVPEMGWAGTKDGALLTKSEKDFDVFGAFAKSRMPSLPRASLRVNPDGSGEGSRRWADKFSSDNTVYSRSKVIISRNI